MERRRWPLAQARPGRAEPVEQSSRRHVEDPARVDRVLVAAGVVHPPRMVSARPHGYPGAVPPSPREEDAMSYAGHMLDTYPRDFNVEAGVLATTMDALIECAQACTADADADLSEQNVAELVKCIRLCLDCADVCRRCEQACRELLAAMLGWRRASSTVARRRPTAGGWSTCSLGRTFPRRLDWRAELSGLRTRCSRDCGGAWPVRAPWRRPPRAWPSD